MVQQPAEHGLVGLQCYLLLVVQQPAEHGLVGLQYGLLHVGWQVQARATVRVHWDLRTYNLYDGIRYTINGMQP